MRLDCPNCATGYEVPEGMIPPAGRHVQCTECHTRWFVHGRTRPMLSEEQIITRLEARARPRPVPVPDPEPAATAEATVPAADEDFVWEDAEEVPIDPYRVELRPSPLRPRPVAVPDPGTRPPTTADSPAPRPAPPPRPLGTPPAAAASAAPSSDAAAPEPVPRPAPPPRPLGTPLAAAESAPPPSDAAAPEPVPSAEATGPTPSPAVPEPLPQPAAAPRRPPSARLDLTANGESRPAATPVPDRFIRGFVLALAVFALALAAYRAHAPISARLPAAAPVLEAYVGTIDALRRDVAVRLGGGDRDG